MAIDHKTYPWAARHAFGTLKNKGIYNLTFGYTETHKEVAAGTNTAIMGSTATALTAQTISGSSITNPDAPRVLKVVVGGTAGHIADETIEIVGTNVEGKTITDTFRTTEGATGTINGTMAFKTVTSVAIPAMLGTSGTISVGTRDVLGVNHRLDRVNTTVKVYTSDTAWGSLTAQSAPTVTTNSGEVEKNLVTPASAPDGTKTFTIFYTYDYWANEPINDEPPYSTTTSTSSTSSSTSTSTITTSTSSTSSSTSSTSSSTSSTSSSTSSTSTSTTTTP